jgi:hypothetical protein
MEQETKGKRIRIVWGSDDDLSPLYANHLYVSHAGETEFHLVFGHLSPPLTMGIDENDLPDSVKIKPVARIIISPEAMKAFVNLLTENFKAFENQQKE